MQENEDELFGEMWQDLEVPDTSFSSLSSSSSPSSSDSPPSIDSTPSISIIPPPPSAIITSSFEINTNEIQQPLTSSCANTDTISSKKRKTPEGKENKHSPHTWQDYSFGPQTSSLVDSITLEQMSDNVDVAAQIVNPNCFYSNEHSAWVCYRQNQFKVFCMFKGPDLHTMCVNDKGVPRRIEAMCAKLYGVKEVAGVHGDGMRVGLHKVGKNRLKSAKNEVEITPFVKGKIEFSNLQFEKSNAAKKPQPQTEYFHIVLILYAKSENTMFPVLSKISAKIVVRGQNPGFYKDEENVSNTTSRIFATPQSLLGMQMDEFSNNFDNTANFDNNANLDNNANIVYDSTSSSENSDNSPTQSPLHHSSLAPPSSVPSYISPSISPGISPSVSPYITPELSPTHSPLSPSVTPPNPNAILPAAMDYSSYPFTTPLVPTFQSELSEIENILLKKSYDSNIVYNRKEKEIPSWMQDGNTVYHYGRVGINTSVPMEALTVHGNMLVTGDIYKPSDRRIKSQFEIVDNTSQLGRIRQLKIYDYCVQNRQERGVIAQELAAIMPEAVHGVGDAEFGSITIPNLLVVNERTLLYENLGATKQLDHDLQYEKAHVVNLSSQVEEITETTNKQNSEMQGTLHSVVDTLFREEHKKKINYAGLEEEFVNFQFSVFRMGPARSLFILGHFASWFWVIGSLFIFSNVRYRKILGWFSFIRLILTWRLFTSLHPLYAIYYDLFQLFLAFFGMIFAIIVLRLNHTRLKRQFKFPNAPPPPPPTTWWGKVKEEICVCLFY